MKKYFGLVFIKMLVWCFFELFLCFENDYIVGVIEVVIFFLEGVSDSFDVWVIFDVFVNDGFYK